MYHRQPCSLGLFVALPLLLGDSTAAQGCTVSSKQVPALPNPPCATARLVETIGKFNTTADQASILCTDLSPTADDPTREKSEFATVARNKHFCMHTATY
jgi:hypothetical protein